MNRAPFGPNGPFQISERERLFAEMEQRQATGWASFAPGEHSCAKGGPCLCKKGQADRAGGCGGCKGKAAVPATAEAAPVAPAPRPCGARAQAEATPVAAAPSPCAQRAQAAARAGSWASVAPIGRDFTRPWRASQRTDGSGPVGGW